MHCSISSYSFPRCTTIGSITYITFHCLLLLLIRFYFKQKNFLSLIDFLKNESELNMMMTRIFNFRSQSVSNDAAAVWMQDRNISNSFYLAGARATASLEFMKISWFSATQNDNDLSSTRFIVLRLRKVGNLEHFKGHYLLNCR